MQIKCQLPNLEWIKCKLILVLKIEKNVIGPVKVSLKIGEYLEKCKYLYFGGILFTYEILTCRGHLHVALCLGKCPPPDLL